MMRSSPKATFFITFGALSEAKRMDINMKKIPRIERVNDGFSFFLDDKPFIMLAAELHNSACTSPEYMQTVWKRVKELNCNTILAPVYWELIEETENVCDFSMVKDLITDAREQNLKLVLLWFGSWKNGCSSYAPEWVKTDLSRFPRVVDVYGANTKILSMFQSEILIVESRTFMAFMKFLRDFDSFEQTVIAVQVENEVGTLGVERDFSIAAEKKFNNNVPDALIDYLNKEEKCVLDKWNTRSDNTLEKTWRNVFEKYAEEAFMGWHYARHINQLAKLGKQHYALPMFTNAWQKEFDDEKPGYFPCGGPLPEILNIWKCAVPDLDLLAPDIYTFDFKKVAYQYARNDNPLFIPETRRDKWCVSNLYLSVGTFNTLCYSPFGAESIGENKSFITRRIHTDAGDKNVSNKNIKEHLAHSYQIFSDMMPIITKYYGTDKMIGFSQDEKHMSEFIKLGDFRIRVEYYHIIDDDNDFIPGAGIVMQEKENGLIFVGYGYRAYLETTKPGKQLDFLSLEKGTYDQNAKWRRYMVLNGDEQHIQMEEEPTIIKAVYYEL